jgi:uncharacterized RDD family membrane protein YckC
MSTQTGQTFRTQNIEWQARLQGVQLASFRSRALAFVIDGLIVSAVLVGLSLWPSIASFAPGRSLTLTLDFGSLVGFAVVILYFGITTYLGEGATLGKRLLGIRVVSLVHSRLSLWHCIERALGYAASSLEAGFGFLQYFKHPNRQTVHDRIAETIVIVSKSPKPKSTT